MRSPLPICFVKTTNLLGDILIVSTSNYRNFKTNTAGAHWVTSKGHIDNIVTYAKQRITNALAEEANAKIEKTKRMACGYRNRSHFRTTIYLHCGGLDLSIWPPVQPSLSFRALCTQNVGDTHKNV